MRCSLIRAICVIRGQNSYAASSVRVITSKTGTVFSIISRGTRMLRPEGDFLVVAARFDADDNDGVLAFFYIYD